VYEVVVHDLDAAPVLLAAVLPDLTFLLGIGQPHGRGQLPARAVPAYNLAHRPILPLLVIGLSVGALLAARVLNAEIDTWESARAIPLLAYAAGLAWLAHIAIDRACGFGLRTPDGWQRDAPSPRG